MDDVLEDFIRTASDQGVKLDYSLESLDALEELLVLTWRDGDAGELLKNRAARYLGEVFRKRLGGRWDLCLKDPKYLYFKRPVISGYSPLGIEFCPIEVVANFLHSRRACTLRTTVDSHLEFRQP